MNLKEQLDALLGADAFDSTGVKIGAVRQVYVDDASGKLTFASVSTGLFSADAIVPLHGARLLDDELHVDHTRQVIKDSPRPDDTEDALTPDQEVRLLEYYGVEAPGGAAQAPPEKPAGTPTPPREKPSSAARPSEKDRSAEKVETKKPGAETPAKKTDGKPAANTPPETAPPPEDPSGKPGEPSGKDDDTGPAGAEPGAPARDEKSGEPEKAGKADGPGQADPAGTRSED